MTRMPRCRDRLVDDRFSISMRLAAAAEPYGTGAAPDDETMTPFAQVASDAGLQHLDVIAEVQDVDGAFIGPAVSTGTGVRLTTPPSSP